MTGIVARRTLALLHYLSKILFSESIVVWLDFGQFIWNYWYKGVFHMYLVILFEFVFVSQRFFYIWYELLSNPLERALFRRIPIIDQPWNPPSFCSLTNSKMQGFEEGKLEEDYLVFEVWKAYNVRHVFTKVLTPIWIMIPLVWRSRVLERIVEIVWYTKTWGYEV